MTLGVFAKGLVIGFSIAAPVGPIGLLCIRRTLADGRLAGLATGLGAAAADATYGAIAAFGLTWITRALIGQQSVIRLVGGGFLVYLGVRTFLARPNAAPVAASGRAGVASSFGTTFLLTITNPMTILSFAAVFAGLGLGASGARNATAGLMVLGVLLGSAAWWLLLSGAVSLARTRVDARRLAWVNRASGVLITGFGVAALASLALDHGGAR